jgi:hypothetical protein
VVPGVSNVLATGGKQHVTEPFQNSSGLVGGGYKLKERLNRSGSAVQVQAQTWAGNGGSSGGYLVLTGVTFDQANSVADNAQALEALVNTSGWQKALALQLGAKSLDF